MTVLYDDLYACVDCTLFLANGDLPEDRPDLLDDIGREWPDPVHMVLTSDEDTDIEFSSRDCDCCGSRLAGSRHPFVILG